MRRIDASALLLAAVSIIYPLVAALAVRHVGPGWVVGALCALLVARSALGLHNAVPGALTYALLFVAGGVALVALVDQELSVRLYPALMNAAMLAAFALSLRRGPSMIERFARIAEPDLPESGVRYTRKVTWVWVFFFLGNGLVAAWTAVYADWRVWTLYNGVIAYVGIGALIVGEWIVRPLARRAAGSPQ
jgi:uncharacterized membrane protein